MAKKPGIKNMLPTILALLNPELSPGEIFFIGLQGPGIFYGFNIIFLMLSQNDFLQVSL